jgi:hypothetical protein
MREGLFFRENLCDRSNKVKGKPLATGASATQQGGQVARSTGRNGLADGEVCNLCCPLSTVFHRLRGTLEGGLWVSLIFINEGSTFLGADLSNAITSSQCRESLSAVGTFRQRTPAETRDLTLLLL